MIDKSLGFMSTRERRLFEFGGMKISLRPFEGGISVYL